MRSARLAAALAVLAASARAAAPAPAREIALKTRDGWTLAALYRAPLPGRPVIVLIHGVGSSKNEWAPLSERLAAQGVGALALDLRGHGGSLQGPQGPRSDQDFDAAGEWPRALEDPLCATRWLKARGIPAARVAFGGASIGANLASQAAAREPRAPFLLLLSPGPDYRGVVLRPVPGVRTLAAAASGDAYAFSTLAPLARSGAKTLEAPAGHGTQMFADTATLDKIEAWIIAASKNPRAP
ncbi:MAG: alpha/beta fold hydrolase [Elusimicrobia bacterium]|nr:alpha/beta fold hydrolase [Elusimicrobiota bacterium]